MKTVVIEICHFSLVFCIFQCVQLSVFARFFYVSEKSYARRIWRRNLRALHIGYRLLFQFITQEKLKLFSLQRNSFHSCFRTDSSKKFQVFLFFNFGQHFHFHWNKKEEQPHRSTKRTQVLVVLLIHSANPQSRPVRIIVFAHVVRASVPTFQILQNKTTENNVRYWRDCGSGRVDHWWHLSCTLSFYVCNIGFILLFLIQHVNQLTT